MRGVIVAVAAATCVAVLGGYAEAGTQFPTGRTIEPLTNRIVPADGLQFGDGNSTGTGADSGGASSGGASSGGTSGGGGGGNGNGGGPGCK